MNQTPIDYAVAIVMPQAVATGRFKSIVNIQAPSGTYTASGQPDGIYVPVAGLQNIPAMDSPESVGGPVSVESRQPDEIMSQERRHVLLNAYYPLLSPSTNWGDIGWICEMDGVTYDIHSAEQDSQLTQTRLILIRTTI